MKTINKKNLLFDDIVYYICITQGINKKSLLQKYGSRKVSLIRHIFCKIASEHGYSTREIARYLNNRDHTTIIYSIKTAEALIKTDVEFELNYTAVKDIIKY